jgi:hypothetical protein
MAPGVCGLKLQAVSGALLETDLQRVVLSVQYRHDQSLQAGESFHTFRTFAAVHQGDYFQTLLTYRRFRQIGPYLG